MLLPSSTTFGWQLFSTLLRLGAAKGGNSVIVSIWGVWLALLLALNGAGPSSDTHRQLCAVLNCGLQQRAGLADILAAEEQLTNETRCLSQLLQRQSASHGSKLVMSSGLWAKDVTVDRAYVERMWRSLKTPVQSVKSAFPINAWLIKNTNGMVKEALPAGSTDFDMLITTAVYFKGSWQYKFNPIATSKQPFTTPAAPNTSAPGKVVQVDMMYQAFRKPLHAMVSYGELDGHFRAVKLPYLGSSLAAIAVLPDLQRYKYDLAAAAAGITPSMLFGEAADWRSMYDVAKLELQLPKFSVSVPNVALTEALEAMGVSAAFDETADLSRITNSSLFINDVLQTAVLLVDEQGTEAVAATTGLITTTAYAEPVPPLTFNRPFLFLIVDDATRIVLFVAAVNDPSVGGR